MRLISKVRKRIVREIDIDDIQFANNEVRAPAHTHTRMFMRSRSLLASLSHTWHLLCLDLGQGQLCNRVSRLLQ